MGYLWEQAGNFLRWLLISFYQYTGSWGWSIILLTILFKIVTHPLTQYQMDSMQKMQKLQPRIKVLQDKYQGEDDKEALSKEMMNLYRENKINPASGCLPLLIQMPILILLFGVLRDHGFVGATFLKIHLDGSVLSTIADAIRLVDANGLPLAREQIGFVTVLFSAMTAPGLLFSNIMVWLPNMILLLLNAFFVWYQQRISSTGNPQMAMMNWFMPLFLAFICMSLQGGVLLYWGVSALIGVVHQMHIVRKAKREMQEKPILSQEKPRKSA